MRVFAPSAFRDNGIDYHYGWHDLPQAVADDLLSAGHVSHVEKAVNEHFIRQSPTIADLPSASGFVGVAQVIQKGLISANSRWIDQTRQRAPRVVKNNLIHVGRYPNATISGTGTKTQSNESSETGVLNGVLAMRSGSAGRSFHTSGTLTLSAGQWYAYSFEVTNYVPGDGAQIGSKKYNTAVINRGSVSITAEQLTAGGLGRYCMTFMSVLGGSLEIRTGIGWDGNTTDKQLTVKNFQLEEINPSYGYRCSEYVYPGYKSAFDCENSIAVDYVTSKVTESVSKVKFKVLPYSNILSVGDSRNDEITNIGGALNTALSTSGVCHIHADGGWKTSDVLASPESHGALPTITDAINGRCLRMSISTAGNEEVYDYLYAAAYPFDTLMVTDLGYNDINADQVNGYLTAYDNIVTMCAAAMSAGLDVIIVGNNPCSGAAGMDATTISQLKTLNNMLSAYCSENNFMFIDIYDLLGDSSNADLLSNGAGTTPDYLQDDGLFVHLNDAGSTAVAGLIKSRIDVYK